MELELDALELDELELDELELDELELDELELDELDDEERRLDELAANAESGENASGIDDNTIAAPTRDTPRDISAALTTDFFTLKTS